MTVKEFIQAIEDGNFCSLGDIKSIEGDFECVSEHQDLNQHYWYSTAVDVYKLEDGFVGVWGLFQIFSETSIASDFGITCKAFEMEAVPSITYREKAI